MDNCELSDGETLKVDYTLADNAQNANVTVSDVLGNRKLSQECNSEDSSLCVDLSGLKSGVYIVSFVVDNCLVDSKRIMK
ncbi:MAG: T9SS type A sorting domain-containing protein [Muribaculaceae bacterium]|nr:T9SS type A sorting domain-containing protein [Muribaculaceae bacterium]